jgi:xylulose-5-phosphate/fructose-6-phosphate phosphoketolase
VASRPLLTEELKPEHVKPRLLGHWGTTPGLNILYVHLNRVIKNWDLDAIFIAGPGHGGPGVVANTYLEGTYSELYPIAARAYTRELGDDAPEIKDWKWQA